MATGFRRYLGGGPYFTFCEFLLNGSSGGRLTASCSGLSRHTCYRVVESGWRYGHQLCTGWLELAGDLFNAYRADTGYSMNFAGLA